MKLRQNQPTKRLTAGLIDSLKPHNYKHKKTPATIIDRERVHTAHMSIYINLCIRQQHHPNWNTLLSLFFPLSLSNCFHTMNFTGGSQSHSPAIPHRRKPKNSHFAANSRSRNPGPPPTTPLSSWKFVDDNDEEQDDVVVHHDTKLVSELFRRARVQVSARKLSAGLWHMRFTEVSVGAHCNQLRPQVRNSLIPCRFASYYFFFNRSGF